MMILASKNKETSSTKIVYFHKRRGTFTKRTAQASLLNFCGEMEQSVPKTKADGKRRQNSAKEPHQSGKGLNGKLFSSNLGAQDD